MEIRNIQIKIIISKLKELFPIINPTLEYSKPFEFLVAVMLSAQSTDKQVNKVTKKLFRKYPNIVDYITAEKSEFEKDISSVGLYRRKAMSILAVAEIIHNQYNDKVPNSLEKLIQLPGVGRKTANVALGQIYKKAEGIAVDTHVIRISRLYNLTKNSDPIKIEKDLLKIIPKSEWINFTMRVIEYGRKFCPATSHDHLNCPLEIALNKRE